METIQLVKITPNELVALISEKVREQLQEFSTTSQTKPDNPKPHLTRKETAQYFGVSLNCINDWCNKGILIPYKVGQRTYFKRSELVQVMFNKGASLDESQ
jgi:hypothetical protein